MNMLIKRALTLVAMGFLTVQAVLAMDSPSLVLQFGAIGSEKKFTHTSTLADGSSVAAPYTRTTFNPTIHAGFDVPLFAITTTSFCNVKLSYDFSWEGQDNPSTSSDDSVTTTYTYTHNISLLPELTFVRGKARFFVGTGLSFFITLYEYERSYLYNNSRRYYSSEYTLYQLLWTTELGAKYYLTKHVAAIGDVGFSVAIMTARDDGEYSWKYKGTVTSSGEYSSYTNNGGYPLYITPRIGICYTF